MDGGGDFYDVFGVDERFRFTVGDVCGSGPRAAAVTGLARNALRILAGQGLGAPEAVGQLNSLIRDNADTSRFITLLHGEIELLPAAGALVRLVVAGHPLPYRVAPGRPPEPVGSSQPLLGVLPARTYTADEIVLAPEELLICLTDGVLERRANGRMLGEDGLDEVLARCATLSAPAAAATVKAAVIDYSPQPPPDHPAVLLWRPPAAV